MNKLLELLRLMFHIGCVGFGGGSALIPMLEKESVTKRKLVTKEEFDKNIVVASVTPGALPVEIASGIGYSVAGQKGMVAGAVGMALPGAILTILLLTLFSNMEAEVLKQIKYLAVGISVYIIYLLVHYMRNAVESGKKKGIMIQVVLVMTTVFLLNGGKELYAVLGLDFVPLFDISSIQVLGIGFFLMFFLSENITWYKITTAGVISILYLLCIGKSQVLQIPQLELGLRLLMFAMGIYGFIQSIKMENTKLHIDLKKILKSLGVWVFVFALFILPACICGVRMLEYIGKGLLSSYMSFGGGDAYLSVAEGMFVNSGMLTEELFYGRLVVVVNILPGSILCKTLSGVGYLIGYEATGTVWIGMAMALAGFGVSVFGSCSISISCLHIYSELENIKLFKVVSIWIRPIIGGLLMSICLSLLNSNMVTSTFCGVSRSIMLLLSGITYGCILLIEKCKNPSAWKVLLGVSLLAIGCCNGLEYLLI